MSLREILLYTIAALCLYLLWIGMRLILIRRQAKRSRREVPDPETMHVRIPANDALREYSDLAYDSEVKVKEEVTPFVSRPAEPDASAFGFDALLEVRQTRHRLDELQASHRKLEAIVSDLSDELRGLRAACQVSPAYKEALALARRGFDAAAIAERCDISVAEAELVASLSSDGSGGKHD